MNTDAAAEWSGTASLPALGATTLVRRRREHPHSPSPSSLTYQQQLTLQRPQSIPSDRSRSRSPEEQAQTTSRHSPSASTSAMVGPAGGRPPRSRKNRPCDLCRRAKTRCTIGSTGPPCTQCLETGKQCTFDHRPPPRKKSRLAHGHGSPDRGGSPARVRSSGRGSDQGDDNGFDRPDEQSGRRRSNSPDVDQRRRRARQDVWSSSAARTTVSHSSRDNPSSTPTSGLDVLASAVPSFDHLANSNYDPHVLTVILTDDLLPIAETGDTCDRNGTVTDRPQSSHVKQISSSDPSQPIFVVMNPKSEIGPSTTDGIHALTHLRVLLRSHPSNLSEDTLFAIYHSQIHPALPVLPQNSTSELPPQLLAAMIVSALSHTQECRPLATLAYNLYLGQVQGRVENSLAGVAASVLEIGVRPMVNSRGAYLQLAKTIALAQLLGMHMNPSRWGIPEWEQELRVRLWWSLAIHDAWMSFLNSRPCHIQADNSTVPLPSLPSVLVASCAYTSSSSDCAKAFIGSCKLAQLVCRLQSQICTLSAVTERSAAERKQDLADSMGHADDLLSEWTAQVSSTEPRATGVNSFLIHLLGFRCMLQRLTIELEHGLGSTFTPSFELLQPFNDCVNFISKLTLPELDGYYLNYASHILSSVVSSLIRLSLGTPCPPTSSALALVAQLMGTLRYLHGQSTWDIAAPALRRAAAVSARFKDLGEHAELCDALQGAVAAAVAPIVSTSAPPLLNNQNTHYSMLPPVLDFQTIDTAAMESQFIWDWPDLDFTLNDFLNMPT